MTTLSETIHKKYFENFCSQPESRLHLFLPKLPKNMVPRVVIVSGQQIEGAGDVDSLRKRCQNVEQLDLSSNAVKTWTNVITILRQLPNLEVLNISYNPILAPFPIAKDPLPALRCLVLNGTRLQWHIIGKVLDALPFLNELHLNDNGYRKVLIDVLARSECGDSQTTGSKMVERKLKPYNNLKILYFRKNTVDKWSEICRLGRLFPSLETLILSECPLEAVGTSKDFQHLIHLNLNDIKAKSWDDIDQLARFPSLTALCTRRWPLWNECGLSKHQIWWRLIVRLPDVKQLNRSLISMKDREDAHLNHMSTNAI